MFSKRSAALGFSCLAVCAFAQAQSERIFLDGFDPPSAMRISELDLRDPHVYVDFLGCRDITDTPLAGFSVNGQLHTQIQTDGDSDGLLDRSDLLLFQPLDIVDEALGALDWLGANCTAPIGSTSCTGNGSTPLLTTYMAHTTGLCLTTLPGTTHGYTPSIASSNAACFVTPANDIQFALFGTTILLHDAQIAASWSGTSPTTLFNGLLRGFLTETDADNTIIGSTLPLVGGMSLSSLLPGGDPPGANNTNCAPFSDIDINDGVRGWWFYFNFSAGKVPFTP